METLVSEGEGLTLEKKETARVNVYTGKVDKSIEAAIVRAVAGFLNALAGAIPNSGDTFFYSGLQLSVAKRDDRHVSLVRVRRRPRTE